MTLSLHFMDSFDNSTTPAAKWTGSVPSVATIGTGGRGGSQRLLTGSGTSGSGSVVSPTLTTASTRIVGFAFNLNSGSTSTRTLVQIRNGTTVHLDVRALSVGGGLFSIQVTRNGTILATTASNYVQSGVWNHLCVKGQLSATSGQVRVMVNGVEDLAFTAVTQNGATTVSNNVSLLGLGQTLYDDFYTGGSDTTTAEDMPGDRRVMSLAPSAAGDQTTLDLVGAATNWQAVASSDGDTSYVWSRDPGEYDLYLLGANPAPVLSVDAVSPYMLARKDDAGTRVARLVTKAGTTTVESGSFTLSEAYTYYSSFLATNPDTSAAWSPADLTTLQIGPKVQS